MTNPLARPQTLGHWLLNSICWTVAGAGGWWWLTTSLLAMNKDDSGLVVGVIAALLIQALLWWRAMPGAWHLLAPRIDSWLQLVGWVWWILLHLALLAALPLTLFYGLLILAFSGDNGPWFG
jgi:hypothetical protein